MHISKLFIEKSKLAKMYMLGSYLFNKLTVSLNNGLEMASELDEGSYIHVSVYVDEYLSNGGHQAGLDAKRLSNGVFLKFAQDKISHKHKI